MAVKTLPISNVNMHYDFITTLDNQTYLLTFRYNYRAGLWLMDISSSESAPIYMGIPIQVNIDITRQFKAYGIPQGLFFSINNFINKVEATRDSFSKDVVLLYGEIS